MAHKLQEDLVKELQKARDEVEVGERYFHYKHPDNFYTIVAVGFIEATEELCVVYQAEYGDKITWVRTEKEFFSKAKLENGKEVARFTKVG